MTTLRTKKSAETRGFRLPTKRQPVLWQNLARWLLKRQSITAVALIVTMGIIRSSLPSASAPITPGATQKLTVYQGVAIIAPGGPTDDVMELGNAGRDITSSGNIYIRPNATTAGSYFSGSGSSQNFYLSGNLGVGTTNPSGKLHVSVDSAAQSISPFFIENTNSSTTAGIRPLVLRRRDTSNEVYEWFLEMPAESNPNPKGLDFWRVDRDTAGVAQSWSNPLSFKFDGTAYFNGGNVGIGTTTPASRLDVTSKVYAAGSHPDVVPIVTINDLINPGPGGQVLFINGLGSGGNFNRYNITSQWTNLSFGASATGAGFKEDLTIRTDGNVGISQTAPGARLAVNNPTLADKVGSSGDAVYAYADSLNAAISGEQRNGSGWAGYFTGKVYVSSGLTVDGGITMNTVSKSEWKIQVCGVNGGTCLGQYLGTANVTDQATMRYYYNRTSDNTLQSVLVYDTFLTCPAGYHGPPAGGFYQRSTSVISKFSTFVCFPFFLEFVISSSGLGYDPTPGDSSDDSHCNANTPQEVDILRTKSTDGACIVDSDPREFTLFQIAAPVNAFQPLYELR